MQATLASRFARATALNDDAHCHLLSMFDLGMHVRQWWRLWKT
jgi:hypothetical protein